MFLNFLILRNYFCTFMCKKRQSKYTKLKISFLLLMGFKWFLLLIVNIFSGFYSFHNTKKKFNKNSTKFKIHFYRVHMNDSCYPCCSGVDIFQGKLLTAQTPSSHFIVHHWPEFLSLPISVKAIWLSFLLLLLSLLLLSWVSIYPQT